ncbi:MAG: transglycosylase domain-containing protein [Ktedonobacterales bacterium]
MDTTGSTPENGAQEPEDRADQQPQQPQEQAGADEQPQQPPVDDTPTMPLSTGETLAEVSDAGGIGDAGGVAPVSTPALGRLAPMAQRTVRLQKFRRRRRYTLYVRRSARARAAAKSSTLVRAAWATVIALGVVVLLVMSTSIGAAVSYYQTQQSAIQALGRTVSGRDSIRIYDSIGNLLYQYNIAGAQHSIPLAKTPINVVNATISAEDRTFWTNPGVDATSIIRAAEADISHGGIAQGGSTITQQLLKQNLLGAHETFTRKIEEAILATGMTVSGTYTKSQIMELYLNSIDYGHESYGIDAASYFYFGYSDNSQTGETGAQQLDLAQASMLAGIPQNPNLNDPLNYFATAHARQAYILQGMAQLGYITQAQAQAAYIEAAQPHFFHIQTTYQNLAPHFVDFIIQQLTQMVSTGQLKLSRLGLSVYTTLDLDLQNHTVAAVQKHVYGNDRDDYTSGLIRNDNLTNSAAIMVQQSTGDIKVMVGSANYYDTKIDGTFNVATQGYRGPGSAFKPLAYATAFEKGWFPAMTISDTPTVFWDPGAGKTYKPLDFYTTTPKFAGELTLRQALQNSLNIPAVKVMQYVGVDTVKNNAQRWGIHSWEGAWGLSSVLGAIQVTPYDMAQVYSVFANYGQYIPLHSINYITDSANNVLFRYKTPTPVQVLSPQVAYMLTNVLSDNKDRTEFGLCSVLYLDPATSIDLPGYYSGGHQGAEWNKGCTDILAHGGYSSKAWPAAAKTGTGQFYSDDWTMGYTMDYTMAVWAGNSNNTSMYHIDGVTGAAPTWYRSMLYAEQRDNLPKRQFPVPSGLQHATWTSNGITSTDWFMAGPLPPNNIGSTGSKFTPCFTNDVNNPWNFCGANGSGTPTPGKGGAGGPGGGGGHGGGGGGKPGG